MSVVQIYKEMPFRNPVEVYDEIRAENTYLLESREGSEKLARYSIIGFEPMMKLKMKEGNAEVLFFNKQLKKLMNQKKSEYVQVAKHEPLTLINFFLKMLKPVQKITWEKKGEINHRFIGGFVGYLSYDFIRYIVNIDKKTADDLNQPDCEFVFTKNNIIFDHKQQKAYFISNEVNYDGKYGYNSVYGMEKNVDAKIEDLKSITGAGVRGNSGKRKEKSQQCYNSNFVFFSNMRKEEYEESVKAAKEYIYAGDIFQVVLSQRLETDFYGDCFNVYRALTQLNPSPYMYFLDFGERKIVGASPEMLARVENRKIETCPIAGTRMRGRDVQEDKKLEEEMLSDKKERAEHLMLVDLARNDVGRVAEFGSVQVPRFMYAEKYSHVQHIVSEVTGKLQGDKSECDALRSAFPAGTVSGAPKVRAMEIIEELEATRRGIYAGCVGYFSLNHNIDTAIAIRTVIFERCKKGKSEKEVKAKAYVQAGAGIVADSNPEMEYSETMNKCSALLKCMSMLGLGEESI